MALRPIFRTFLARRCSLTAPAETAVRIGDRVTLGTWLRRRVSDAPDGDDGLHVPHPTARTNCRLRLHLRGGRRCSSDRRAGRRCPAVRHRPVPSPTAGKRNHGLAGQRGANSEPSPADPIGTDVNPHHRPAPVHQAGPAAQWPGQSNRKELQPGILARVRPGSHGFPNRL